MLSIPELVVIGSVIVVLFVAGAIVRLARMRGRSSSRTRGGGADGTPAVAGSDRTGGIGSRSSGSKDRATPEPRQPARGHRLVPGGGAADDSERLRLGLLDDAFDQIDHAVVVVDGRGRRVLMNAAARRLRESRDGGLLVDAAMKELSEQVLTTGGPLEREVEVFGPPARTFVVTVRALDRGDGSGAMAIAEDVTIRRRVDSVRRDFVSNISHELKSPVAAIGLLADMIVGERDPEILDRLSARMVHESDRMNDTIDDLLALANLEFEDGGDFDDVRVADLVAEALERIAPAADRAGVRIETEMGSEGPIRCDRRQIVTALHNLLDNAVKYSGDSGMVELGVRPSDPPGMTEFVVRDDGVGIPRRDQDRIFERFYRVDRARSRATGGTGLGLTIVRHVADNHGGDVSVESREGAGSTFVLRIADIAPGSTG